MSENAIDDEHVIDMVQVRNEVAAEVRARRAAGEYPPAFERELDALFARFAPAEVTENLADALERSEDAAGIDPEIPVASNNPAFGLVKRVMARLLGWYHQFVAQQVTGLGVAVNNVLRSLVEKVTDLESLTGDLERARLEVARIEPERDDELWRADVVDALAEVQGRVAVLEAGDCALLSAICERGVDAYGVDPRVDSVDAARRRGVDVRLDDVTGHLQAVAPGDLAGVVLRACVERLAAGELLQLLDLATRALRAGGRCIVVSATPQAWGSSRSRVEADLARGRPLHPETWVRLLEAQGYDGVDVRTLGDEGGLTPVAGDGPDAAVVNANLARISEALFGPAAFIVVATRPA